MKKAQRSIAMFMVIVLCFTLVDWTMGRGTIAYADNVATAGSSMVNATPDALLEMGEWVYWVEDNQAMVAGYRDEGVSSLQIPAHLGGYPVTGIGQKAFSANYALSSIQIPMNVTRIAEDAFDGLQGLTINAYHGAYALSFAEKNHIYSKSISNVGGDMVEGVIDLTGMPSGSYYNLTEYSVSFKAEEATFLKAGQMLFFPKNAQFPTGLARRVVSVSEVGGDLNAVLSQPEIGECFSHIYGEDEFWLDWDNAVLADGFEFDYDVIEASGIIRQEHKDSIPLKFSKNIPLGEGFGGKLTGDLTLSMSGGYLYYDVDTYVGIIPSVNKLEVKLPIRADVTVTYDAGKWEKDFKLPVSRIPIVSVYGIVNGYVDLYWHLEFSGNVVVNAWIEVTPTITYQNGRVNFPSPQVRKGASVELNASAATGPKVSFVISIGFAGFDLLTVFEGSVGLYVRVDGSAKASTVTGSERLHTCLDANVGVEVPVSINIGVVKFGSISGIYLPFNHTFGPWWIFSGHWDDLHYVGNPDNCALNNRRVTIQVDGKSTSATYNVGDWLNMPETPHKAGYTFEGWYVNTAASKLPGNDYAFNFRHDVMPYCGLDGTLTIYAKFVPIPVKSVSLNKSNETIYTNNQNGVQLQATISPANAADTSVRWSSSNERVATVNSNGKVMPVAAGTATITCTSKSNSSVKATFTITVKQYAEKVSLSASLNEIFERETLQINASVSPSDTTDKSLTWSSSDTSIATVDQNGKITGVKSGTVTIKATAKDRGTVYGQYDIDILLPVTGILLDKTNEIIYTNNTNGLAIHPTLTPAAAILSSVKWESSNPNVATVDKNGVVMPIAPGTVTITCRSKSHDNVTATCDVTVKQFVESISIQRSIASIAADESMQLSTTVLPNNATDKSLTWSSSNTGVATVNNEGFVTGVSAGSVNITATANDGSGKKDTFRIVVVALPENAPDVTVTGVTANSSLTGYTVHKTIQASASVSPSNADQSIVWASTNEDVATIDNTGMVTMLRGGATILTGRSVSDPHKYVDISLRVVQSVESIAISGENKIEDIGESTTLTAIVTPDYAEDKSVSWSSSNSDVATINQNGLVTAVSNGVTEITATAQDGSQVVNETKFYVKVGRDPIPVESITLDMTSVSKYTNEKDGITLTPTVLPAYADDLSVIWASSDEQVATVDKNGKITFSAPGTTTVTCRSVYTPTVTATCQVTVKQYVEQIVLDGDKYSVLPGETVQLTATVYPNNASDKSLTWSSSDTKVATVSQSGKVTAVGHGKAVIKATAKDGSGAEALYSVVVEKELQLDVSLVNDTVFTKGDEKCDIAYVSLTNASVKRMADAGNTLIWSMTKKSGSGDTAFSILDTSVATGGRTYNTTALRLTGTNYPTAGEEVYSVTCKAGAYEETVDVTVTVDGTDYADSIKLRDVNVGFNTFTANVGESIDVPAAPMSADGKPVPTNLQLELIGDSNYTKHATVTDTTGLAICFDESNEYTATINYCRGNLVYPVMGTFYIKDENGIVRIHTKEITLSKSFTTLVQGKTETLTATVQPEDAYDNSVEWNSLDTSVATVTSDGVVRAIAPGTTLITCTSKNDADVTASCSVTVERYLQLDTNEQEYSIYAGGEDHVDLDIINLTIASQIRLVEDNLNVTWTLERLSGSSTELGLSEFISRMEYGVSVSGNVLKLLRLTGVGTDEYRLTCSAGNYSDSCNIRVIVKEANLPETLTLNQNSYTVPVNERVTINTEYMLTPSGSALPEDVKMTIDGGRAFIDALSGLYSFSEPETLIFEKPGTYIAYVNFLGTNYSYRCPVMIDVADENGVVPVTITEVIVSDDQLLLTTGDTRTLSVSVEPSNASYSRVNWSSTNTAVATVSSAGKVTAIGPGYASIVASIPESDYEGACLVYVEEGINFQQGDIERTVFVDGTTRMTLDTVMLTENTSTRLSQAPEWSLKRISGISMTLRAEPYESKNTQGNTLYGCALQLYSVSKEGDTIYELTCSNGSDRETLSVTVHAVNRDQLLPASISLDQTVFTADIGELIVVQPLVTTYPEGSKLPNGIVVSCEGDLQYFEALNYEDTYVSQSRSTFSFNKAGTYQANMVYAYSNMKYVVPVTFRIRNENGDVPVQAKKMTLSKKSLSLTVGEMETLETIFTPSDTTDQKVTWRSSNKNVATVDANGKVTAISNGFATIYCIPSDKNCETATCAVTVEDYLAITTGTTSQTLYVQGNQENTIGFARLSAGTIQRLEAAGLQPDWTLDADTATHAKVRFAVAENGETASVTTESLLSSGTDTVTIRCKAGEDIWSQTFVLNVVDLGPSAPTAVSITTPEVTADVNETIAIDFTPVFTPANASLPNNTQVGSFVGIGDFYNAVDRNVYRTEGNTVTLAFTKPGQYLLTRRYTLRNLQYVTSCRITVGGSEGGLGVLNASETAFTVYSGGKSGSVSTIEITDSILYQAWQNEIVWTAERISGDSLTVALKDNGSSVDVFVANILKKGTDVWRVNCAFGGMTESVDITLTASDPRGSLPETIALANNHVTGMIGNEITVPLGVSCSPGGTMLPDQGDEFWSFHFDQAGEERCTHSIENGLLHVVFTMSGYYTGTLRYQSGNVWYEIPIYFTVQDEEQEVKKPDLKLFAVNTFDTVYPEGETGIAIGQIVIAESLSTYNTGAAIAYLEEVNASWKVSKTGTAATLSLRKISNNVYDLILDQIKGSGNVTYTVTCTVDGKAHTISKTLHVASSNEDRPSATLKHTVFKTSVGEEVIIDNRVYAKDDGSVLQSSTKLDATELLAAVGYEIEENSQGWSMVFYQEGTYQANVYAQVSNLKMEVPIVVIVKALGTEPIETVLILPAALTEIEQEAFEGIAADVIDLRGTNIRVIGDGAFKNSVNTTKVFIPDTVTYIADNAFFGCLNVTIYCDADSYAAQWAARNRVPCINP